MTSKERVLTAFSNQEPDRVPIDYLANPGIDRRLKAHFRLRHDDDEGLREILGVDFRSVDAPHRGRKLHQDILERGVKVDNWGIHRRWIEHETGGYWDFCDLARAYDIYVMMHTCGSSSWAYEDFIEMGIHIVDTLQPEAKDMSPEYLKRKFGGRLAFHGCISTAGPVACGSVDETITYCRKTLDTMMPDGGYCFAPTHCLQDNSPTENVVAMYETVKKYGVY